MNSIYKYDIVSSDFYNDYYLYNLNNFWNDFENILPDKCNSCDKYLGTNKDCIFCIKYRKCVK